MSGWTPTAAAARAAREALDVRASLPRSQRAGTSTGIARAHQLAARRHVSDDTVRRMVAFFARNARFADAVPPSKSWQAWNLWGGDAARKDLEHHRMACCNPRPDDRHAAAAHAALARLRMNPPTRESAEMALRRAYDEAVGQARVARFKLDKAATAAAVEDAARYAAALKHYDLEVSVPYQLVEDFAPAPSARQPDLFGLAAGPASMPKPRAPRAEQFDLFRSNPDDDDAWTYAYNTQAADVLEGLSEAELRDELREARAAAAKWTRLAREADAADDYPAGMVAHYRQLADAIEYRLRPRTRSNPALNAEVAAYLDGAERIAQSIIDLHEVETLEGDLQAAHLARAIRRNVVNLRQNYALGDPRMARHNAMTAIYVYQKLRELVEYLDDPDTEYKQGARELHAWLEQAARNPLLLNAADYYRDNPRATRANPGDAAAWWPELAQTSREYIAKWSSVLDNAVRAGNTRDAAFARSQIEWWNRQAAMAQAEMTRAPTRANPIDLELARAYGLAAQKLDKAKPSQRQRTPRAAAAFMREVMGALSGGVVGPDDVLILSYPLGVSDVITTPNNYRDPSLNTALAQLRAGASHVDLPTGQRAQLARVGPAAVLAAWKRSNPSASPAHTLARYVHGDLAHINGAKIAQIQPEDEKPMRAAIARGWLRKVAGGYMVTRAGRRAVS